MLDRRDVAQFGRGLLMGSADIVPGVSGGTVALVLGIYARLVTAISQFDAAALSLLAQRRFRDLAAHLDLRFLAALGLGIATAIVTLASVIRFALEEHRQHTFALFFGLILGSSLLVARLVPWWTAVRVLWLCAGAVGAYFLVGMTPLQQPPQFHPGYLFVCGFFAICAMILPGISGAFLLLIFGAYSQVTDLIHRGKRLDLSANDVLCLVVFIAGMAIGLISFTKILRTLLARHESTTLAILTGFMLGSLRKLWPFQIDLTPDLRFTEKLFSARWPDFAAGDTWFSIMLLVVGVATVFLLEVVAAGRKADTLPHNSAT